MKLKEKEIQRKAEENAVNKELPPLHGAAGFFLSAAVGALAARTSLGGGGAPLCAAYAAVVSPLNGIAAFGGAMAAFFLGGEIRNFVTEIAAMPAVILSRALAASVSGKRLSPLWCGALSGAAYLMCGIIAAVTFKSGAAAVMAVLFRSIITAAAAFFTEKTFSSLGQNRGITAENGVSAAVVYAFAVCTLCGISIGSFNAGRAAGAFVTAAAAFRYGCGGGGIAGALTVLAASAVCPGTAQSAAAMVCSGICAGKAAPKGRLASAAAFILTGLACSLICGLPSDSPKVLIDMICGGAVFCLVPDKLFRRALGRTVSPPSAALNRCGVKMSFAAAAVKDVKACFLKASSVLDGRERKNDIASRVCGKVCSSCRSSAFCGESQERRIEDYFRPAEDILAKKGFITEKELHKGLECCVHKNALAEAFNSAWRSEQIERRLFETSECMREITAEHLSGTVEMLKNMCKAAAEYPSCDEGLSEYVRCALAETGVKKPAAAVFFDGCGRIYIECFFEGMMNVKPNEFAQRLDGISDRELDPPEIFTEGGITRLCFHEQTVFAAEVGHASVCGKEDTSGDYGVSFSDGTGNLYILISDGMGSGARAAVESRMTVSMLKRLICAGTGAAAAVRFINLMLLTKSSEEIFSTVDMAKINLFSGKTELLKMGAAQSFIKSNGTVKTVESWSVPVGIVSSPELCPRTAQLSDGDELVMITDGICEDCFPSVREHMLSMGVTAQDCAERIIAAAEKDKQGDLYRQDDKTVYAVKLHKI
ncbi:MAG: SpoIIE family protein phosphatase [Oscillospiraceae bacterium]|nr:SpoIIE family protein phosphatase [Oscillospiraceae bacterium]